MWDLNDVHETGAGNSMKRIIRNIEQRNEMKWQTDFLTFPIIGRSTDPHVSAAQCTRPEAKSAVIMPHKAETKATLHRSQRKCLIISKKLKIIRPMQV